MTPGITLRMTLPTTLLATVADEGARERAERETWHLIGHLSDGPWVSTEIIAADPKLDLVVTRPGIAFLAGDQVQTARGPTYRIVGYRTDPTPAMMAALHRLVASWEPPRVRHFAWAAMLELPPGDHAGRPDHEIDVWHVVRRTEGILVLGWERPGEWEPVMSGVLATFDPLTDTAADAGGRTFKLVSPAEGFMHPLIEDHLSKMFRG